MNKYTYRLLLAILVSAVVILIAVTEKPARQPVPRCQEDEVLVAKDFPYTNTDNLRCLHIEEVNVR